MSIASDLIALKNKMTTTLNLINQALRLKGVGPVQDYTSAAHEILTIPTGGITPTGTKNITENGTYDVTSYASAAVAVPAPSGTKTITTNGTHDVAAYASATVNVPTENPPSGTVNITENGTVDVTNYASAEVAVPTGTARSSSDLTASGATVTVPAGLYSSQASKSVAAATQATPSISVNTSTGVITASTTQSAGYVSAGTKSTTQSLTTQAAQTITPGTSDQTIASGRYLTGAQTIKGDSDLKASNIKSGVTIFNVTGTYEGEGTGELTIDGSGISVTRTGGGIITFAGLSKPTGKSLRGVILQRPNSVIGTGDYIDYLVALNADGSTALLKSSVSNIMTVLNSGVTLTVSSNGISGTVSVNISVTGFGFATDYTLNPIWG